MPPLIHLIYASAATHPLSDEELTTLLTKSRAYNASEGITGILLHAGGSFFQVLEGEIEAVERLFERISRDERHSGLTIIIREPIARRTFGEWTMGFSDIRSEALSEITGVNDLLGQATYFSRIDPGRAKKMLEAFTRGRWRARLLDTGILPRPTAVEPNRTSGKPFTFAFQPIISATQQTVYSYEALLRGGNNEPAAKVLERIPHTEIHHFDNACRRDAIALAARLGLGCHLNLNFLPQDIAASQRAIESTLETAARHGIRADQIVLEIVESEIIHDMPRFVDNINAQRHTGIKIAIDDFGAGYAGLNLLAEFQPDLIKLDMNLVRDIHKKGARQAIARGITRTCFDLGIDIIAEGVETAAEYAWFRDEGIDLFQGRLFAAPGFEHFPMAVYPVAAGET